MPKLDEYYTVQVFGCADGQVIEHWITLKIVSTYLELLEALDEQDYEIIARLGKIRVLDGRGHVIDNLGGFVKKAAN